MSWSPSGQGHDVFKERYALTPEEEWDEACARVAYHVSKAEKPEKQSYWFDRFGEVLSAGLLAPGGRIMYGAGRPRGQMLNCFVIPVEDSMASWGQSLSDLMQITALGGGVGINVSNIRSKDYPISRGGTSTGSVSWARAANGVGDILRGGGGRRIALMICENLDHPDIQEFIGSKLNRQELNNANISVVLPPHISAERFSEAVRNDESLALMWGGRPDLHGREIHLRSFWDSLVHNAWKSGEPGILNSHLANQMNNVWYKHSLISTNPCGEIWLPAYGCCCLGSIVLPRFVTRHRDLDYDYLEYVVRIAVRFLDDVLTMNDYPLTQIAEVAQGERRIGLGTMGLHSMLLDMGRPYGSDGAQIVVEDVWEFIRDVSYDESIKLAEEKGSFRYYDSKMAESGYCKTLPWDLRDAIRDHGIRNCALLTQAPTGTTSMVQGVSNGIEPIYSSVYIRRRWKGDDREAVLVFSKEYTDHPDIAQSALDIHPKHHFEMQKTVQKYVDNAVSKTINLRKDFPVEELSDLWLNYLPHLKGTTFYREGSREFEPMEHVPADDVQHVLNHWTGKVEYEGIDPQDCPTGVCDV